MTLALVPKGSRSSCINYSADQSYLDRRRVCDDMMVCQCFIGLWRQAQPHAAHESVGKRPPKRAQVPEICSRHDSLLVAAVRPHGRFKVDVVAVAISLLWASCKARC